MLFRSKAFLAPEANPSRSERFWIRFNHLYALRTGKEGDNWGAGRSIRVLNSEIVDAPKISDKIAVFFLALFYTLFSSYQPESLTSLLQVHAGSAPNAYLGRIWEVEQKLINHTLYFSEDDVKSIKEFLSTLKNVSPRNDRIVHTALFQISTFMDQWIQSNDHNILKETPLNSDPLIQIRNMIKIASKYLPK